MISSVLVAEMGSNSMRITLPIESKTTEGNKIVETPVLLDTGAGGIFMNKAYAKKHNIKLYKLDSPIIPRNVDGTLNQAGKITHYTWIWTNFQDTTILVRLMIMNIRSQDIIFRLPWFKDYNPEIDFVTGKITIQKKAKTGWMKYTRDNRARLAEVKGKLTVTIQTIETEKKEGRKPKAKKRRSSNSPNWRSKDAPSLTKKETRKEDQEIRRGGTPTRAIIEEITEDTTQKREAATRGGQEKLETQGKGSLVKKKTKEVSKRKQQEESHTTAIIEQATIKDVMEETRQEEPSDMTPEVSSDTNDTLDHPEHRFEEMIQDLEEEGTQTSINVLAQLETDNSPLEELWINAKTNVSQKLAIQETADKKEKTLEEMVPPELLDYKDVFDKVTAEWFPESRPWDHAIDLKEDFIPHDCKVYPMTLPEQAKLDKFIDKNLAKGYIRPSKSPMASPLFFVSKKDGKLWPCQDYQKLNEGTVKNSYLLLLISTLLDKLKGARYFTKLDLRSRYNNVRIKDGDQWKAAFKTSRGLFELTVMFFGLCNSPATFQQMMDKIFWDEIHEAWIIIYMDDMFVFTKELADNIRHTWRILQKLWDNDLYVKPEKCVFWQPKVEYLGMIIEENVKYEKNCKEKRRERRRLRSNCREARRDRDNGMSQT